MPWRHSSRRHAHQASRPQGVSGAPTMLCPDDYPSQPQERLGGACTDARRYQMRLALLGFAGLYSEGEMGLPGTDNGTDKMRRPFPLLEATVLF